MEKTTLTIGELQGELNGFCGTQNYYRHFTGLLNYTDGVKHLADRAGAFWLIDAVASYQSEPKIRAVPFQIWTLKVLRSELGKNENEPMAILEMNEDTDKPIIVSQKIPYTDFPKGEVKLYFIDGVLLLPSEYFSPDFSISHLSAVSRVSEPTIRSNVRLLLGGLEPQRVVDILEV